MIRMNKEWSQLNKTMQEQLKKESTYQEGIHTLLSLRKSLMEEITELHRKLDREDFNAMPLASHKGLENKSIAYSLFHVFRIEDIVSNTLIQDREEVFFRENYPEKMNAMIVTTGNELKGQEIMEFSRRLHLDMLYAYMEEVWKDTNRLLMELPYGRLKERIGEKDRRRLEALPVVSREESAVWLIDYWCKKNIRGLIQMPFSRHWIMHVEACGRIAAKLR